MGSFNASCSASNISISEGTDVAFILLKPSQNYKIKDGKIPSLSSFTYSDDLYQPVALPIFAKYNDYGSIEDIVRDANVNALEQYYGITINELVSIVTDGRDALNHCSETFPIFGINSFRSSKVSKEILLENGFTHNKAFFLFADGKTRLVLKENKDRPEYNDVTVFNGEIEKTYRFIGDMTDLQQKIYNDFDIIISLPQEKQHLVYKIKEIDKMSSMFVHKEIYNMMVTRTFDGVKSTKTPSNLKRSPHPVLFEALGFEIEKSPEKYVDIYFMKKNGLTFQYEYESVSFEGRNLFEMDKVFDLLEEKGFPEDKKLIEGIDLFSEKVKFVIRFLPEVDYSIEDKKMIRMKERIRRNSADKLKDIILKNEKWRDFLKTYINPLSESKFDLIPFFDDFLSFSYNFSSSNHMFMPISTGDQCGDAEMSKLLFKKAFSIVAAERDDSFEDSVVENYMYTKNLDHSKEYLLELLEDHYLNNVPAISGLSLFEIKSFIKDNSVLKDILDTYL